MNVSMTISRILFYCRRYTHYRAYGRISACAVITLALSTPLFAANTIVRMEITYGTNQGTIDIELYDDQAPKTVVNFLRYAGRGDYSTNGIIHRSVPGFVLQGGGYTYIDFFGQPYYIHIPEDPPVQNEFSPSRSNVRGTIAMAKLGGNPDSATSEWFFNLADNSANLDVQNGGFTAFGRVLDPGMNVVDAIANLPVWNASATNPAFTNIPLINYDPAAGIGIQPSNLAMVTRIPNVSSARSLLGTLSIFTADVDMIFNSVGTADAATATSWLATFTPPPHKTVQFNDGIATFTMTGTMGTAGRIVTLIYGGIARPTHYYAYGPTPDNTTAHWYDFSYDGKTGAEIMGNKILLHFVDGQRGDDDLTVNNSITHTGAPALVTDIATGSSNSAGCSIATTPSQMTGNGDWILISMFLSFVALVGRRARNGRI